MTFNGTNINSDWVTWTTGVAAGWTVRYKIKAGWCYLHAVGDSVSVSAGNNTIATGITDAAMPRDGATDQVWSVAYVAGAPGLAGIFANGNLTVRATSAASGTVSCQIAFPVGQP